MGDVNLTPQQASDMLAALISDGASLRDAEKRSDTERLAIGLVCLSRNIQGKSQRTIAAELDIPHATVNRYIQRAIKSVQLPTVTEARVQAIEVLDRQLEVWIPKSEAGDEKAALIVAKFLSERNKLTGALAPISIDQTVTEVTAAERELQDMIAQQERDNAMRAEQAKSVE